MRRARAWLVALTTLTGAAHAQPAQVFSCEASQILEAADTVDEEQLGAAMAIGDFNGDGFPDLALGGSRLWFVVPDPLLCCPAGSSQGRCSTSGCSDECEAADAEGLTRVLVFLGTDPDDAGATHPFHATETITIMGNGQRDMFGRSVAFLPDLDDDGRDELVVGAPNWPNDPVVHPTGHPNASCAYDFDRRGRVYLFMGTDLEPGDEPEVWNAQLCRNMTFDGTVQGGAFGASLAATSQFDADAYPDLVIGAPGSLDSDADGPSGSEYKGHALVHRGPSTLAIVQNGPDLSVNCPSTTHPYRMTGNWQIGVLAGASPKDRFGQSVAFIGDVKGSAAEELIVGAPQFLPYAPFPGELTGNDSTGAGYADLYAWDSTAPNDPDLFGSVSGSYVGAAWGEAFGFSVAGGVNFDGDGNGSLEIAVGAPMYDDATLGERTGRVHVFDTDDLAAGALYVPGEVLRGQFGFSVLGLDDVDDDGKGEFLVGAWWEQNAESLECGGTEQGGVQSGSTYIVDFDLDAAAFKRLEIVGEEPRDHGGWALAAGDLDGDCLPDVITSSPAYGEETGRTYVFFGAELPATEPCE